MKRIPYFLLLFFLLLKITVGYAQGDYFAPIGAEWCFGSTPPFHNAEYSKYYSENDTIIMNQICRKISGFSVNLEGTIREQPPLYVYSTPDTVYCYNDSFQLFVPMYIFNVSEGDTLTYHVSVKLSGAPGSSWSDSLFQVVVTKVDSVYVDGIYLRQVWTSPVENWGFIGSYIERIGSTYGMLGNVYLLSFPEAYERGLRSYEDSIISYQNTEYDCEFLPGTAIHQNAKAEKIRIYPNPNNGHFTIINLERKAKEEMEIKVTDLSGRRIFPTITGGAPQLHINMSSFPKGIYLLNLHNNKRRSYHKIIKN